MPNPVSDKLNISFDRHEEILVEVYNIAGELFVNKKLMASGSLDVTRLNNGVYIIKVSDSKGIIFNKKIVKL